MNRRPRYYHLKTPWYNRKYTKKPRNSRLATEYQNDMSDSDSSDELQSSHDNLPNDGNVEQHPDINIHPHPQNIDTNQEIPVAMEFHSAPSSELVGCESVSDSSSWSGDISEDESEKSEDFMYEECLEGNDEPCSGSEPSGSYYNESAKFHDNIRVKDIMFMALNFYIRHKLTQEGLEDLMRMLNVLTISKTFPESFKTFTNVFPAPYNTERVYFCVNCQFGYEAVPQPETVCPVENCGSIKKDFFITFPIEQQIRETFEKYSKEISEYEIAVVADEIQDISRGKLAQSIMRDDVSKYITLSANEDGAAAVKCSNKKPIYPLFLTLNNLPPKLRFNKNNLILAALWFNPGKPNMALFHKNFVLQLQRLRNGMTIGTEFYKVVLLQNCTDSVGRCELFCSKQYNGRYGCTLCLHPGILIGNQIRYPYQKSKAREHEETVNIMVEIERSTSKESIFGIKGLCTLVGVPDFDIINGLPPDYMHMGLIGVTRIIWEFLMTGDGQNRERTCYVGDQKKIIEHRLSSIRLPSCFPRNIRKIDEFLKFKASEWETLLFHCIYPCMYDLMPKQHLDMIMLFSTSIYELLQFQISERTLLACEKSLIKFVKEFQKTFGPENVVYNIHLATHLVESVKNLGALWNSSLFPYENGNGMLVEFHTSNNHPVIQLASKFILNRICHHTQITSNNPTKTWIESLWSSSRQKPIYDHKNRTVLPDDVECKEDVTRRKFNDIGKWYCNGIKICTKSTCANFLYDDSFINVNEQFFHIIRILIDNGNNVYILGQQLITTKLYGNMFTYEYSEGTELFRITTTVKQCVSVTVKPKDENSVKKNFISICKTKTQVD